MGPHASTFELALVAIGTAIVGQWLAGKLYGPKKPKLSDLPFDRFGLLPDHMLNKPEPKSSEPEPLAFTDEERRKMIAEWPAIEPLLGPWMEPLVLPKPPLLLPAPDLHSPLGEDGRKSGRDRGAD